MKVLFFSIAYMILKFEMVPRHISERLCVLRGYGIFLSLCCLIACCLTAPAMAASQWDNNDYAQTRLILGGYDRERQELYLGWHVRLTPGWKTYWRSPGDAGLPPRWSWNEMSNVQEVELFWPTPEKYSIFGMETYVYTYEVVLPMTLRLDDVGRPTVLDLGIEYMVCKDICVPLQARHQLTVPPLAGTQINSDEAVLYAHYQSLLPRVHDTNTQPFFKLRHVEAGKLRLSVTNNTPVQKETTVLIEGPEGVTFSVPQPAVTEGGRLFFDIYYQLDDETLTLNGQNVRLTYIPGRGQAIETVVVVEP
ncbi:MAG: hypothetical protein CMF31_03980 [Kordiimonas sp.]|nr:hypothetical protein [Kordiimonas sp.]|tara:strand:- start:3951 stop:4871 length:921 start_codon:yes stop_codon:yes gene_type:complete